MALFKSKYQELDDNDLPNAFATMNANKVLAEIYKRFGHLMFGTCLKYLKNKSEAEDCVMEIFEKLPEKLSKYEIKYFKSWIYNVTKNECLMRLRKSKPDVYSIDNNLQLEIESDHTEDKKLLELKIDALNDALNELKDEQKVAVELFYLKDMSYKDISEHLNWSLKAVKSAIQNGKRNLKMNLMKDVSIKSA